MSGERLNNAHAYALCVRRRNTFPFTIDLGDMLGFLPRSQQELGRAEEIQRTFVDFRQHLYQEAVGL